jgi:hypothetical protein
MWFFLSDGMSWSRYVCITNATGTASQDRPELRGRDLAVYRVKVPRGGMDHYLRGTVLCLVNHPSLSETFATVYVNNSNGAHFRVPLQMMSPALP